ncbi:MAG: guanylate kinase [Oscillospiraceae bacterium]|nr:guanylate kinase [Oscillospiraceae bacterium]MBQ6902791.1 guanylate kinase [Oscillospiraceae bacterium]
MLIIMSGSAGVGKNTIINELLAEYNNLALMTTVSTRAMRPGEEQGKPYYFVTLDEFNAMVERGEMLETCLIHGNMYGSSRKILEEKTAEGKILIKDIDVEGTLNLKKLLPDVVAIYLKPKSKEQLRERLIGRGEKDIELRLRRYEYEEEMSKNYDYVLVNDKMEDTLRVIREILKEETEKRGLSLSI